MYYPLMLDVRGRLAVVIGGGAVAERKVGTLLAYGARVRLISPEITQRLMQYAQDGLIEVHQRAYRPGDLDEAFLVFAATNQHEVNRQVYHEAVQRGQLVNVVDRPEWSLFHVPSTLRRGRLQISISTAGASPAMARRIRKQLEKQFDDLYAGYLDWLAELRAELQRLIPDSGKRRMAYQMFAEEEVWLEKYRREGHERTLQEARQWIGEWLRGNHPG